MSMKKRVYRAIVFERGKDRLGEHIILLAEDLDEAMAILEERYGAENFIDLYNEEDANRPR